MTSQEIVELAEQLGLHCDHDDDPAAEESILLWHDADTDGGLLFRFHEGKTQLTDLKTLTNPTDNWNAKRRKSGNQSSVIRRCIDDYVERCNALPPRPIRDTLKSLVIPDVPVEPTPPRDHDWRLPSQRKEGAFKAVDPLGHFYYVEVFRDVTCKREETAIQRLVTADGESVERIAKGRYRLSHARLEISSNDPSAP